MSTSFSRKTNQMGAVKSPVLTPHAVGPAFLVGDMVEWAVFKGELVNDGYDLYLTTDKDYGNFEVMVEYKALPEGDSGVYLRGIPQVQIWDTTKGDPHGRGQDKGSGGLWNNSKGEPGKDPSKKNGPALR
jgi:hypothetical protein